MNKTISTERLFSLGDFKNIKFSDTISEIPTEIANNPEASKLLRYLQLLEIEFAYSRYMSLMETLYGNKLPLEQILETLEKERNIVFANLLEAIGSGKHAEKLIEADTKTEMVEAG